MKNYLTVGTDVLKEELMVPICDANAHSDVKSSGGLWLTEFDTDKSYFNVWVNYILYYNQHVLFNKSKGRNPFKQPCCIVTLKDNARIFMLDSKEGYQYLLSNYPKGEGLFSYEKLSVDYDGIFVDLAGLSKTLDSKDEEMFQSFGVSSLILFDLSVVDHYYSGVVEIVPFEPEDAWYHDSFPYTIKWNNEKQYISFGNEDNLEHSELKRKKVRCF